MPLFQNRSHYTLSLSQDMESIETCEFFMSSEQTGKYGDHFRYISVAQKDVRQYGNLGLVGASRMAIVNVHKNSVTCRLKRDADGADHPLLRALTGIQAKLVAAYARDVGGRTLLSFLRPPQKVGHDTLVKFKRGFTVLAPEGEQTFQQGYELSRFLVSVQKITYFNGEPFVSLVLKSAKICPPSTPPRAVRETPQSLLDMMNREAEASSGDEEEEEEEEEQQQHDTVSK